jgi:mono/diheme cytochrome c family protein
MIKHHPWRIPRRSLSIAYIIKGYFRLSSAILILLLAACAAPHNLPAGPTPIPTLIPATEPASPLGATTAPVFTIQSYPARLPSAALGKLIYQNNCVDCHGVDGNGIVPGARNFGDLDYMRGESPAFFYTAVTEGRGDMPSFRDRLTSDERWDVIFYVWRFSTNAETLALGQQLYQTNCAACHGEDGIGTVLGASDFTDLRIVDSRAPRDFYLTVTQGKGSMPAWQGRLSQDERWAVIDYLRTFSYDPALPEEVASANPTASSGESACDPALQSQSNPFAWNNAEAIDAGQAIYNQSCGMCHGADGTGSLAGTPDLTTTETQSLLRADNGEMLCVVAEGRDAMPGWKETLSVEQMWQVLTYIANLEQ